MTNKKFFSTMLVAASLAGVVAFYACNKNDLTPAEDGKKLAQELCGCIDKAASDEAKLKCFSDFESKRSKWRDEDDAKAFDEAFGQEIANCPAPYQWLATFAAAEFCDLAAQNPDGDAMTLAPLYMKYEAELNSGNPAFLEPFFGALMACSPDSDWILCFFRMTDFCNIELSDEELIELAAEAAPEFCDYFTANPTADMNLMLASDLAKYATYFSKEVFIGTLLQGLTTTCATTPQWFICMMTGNQAPGCN